MTLKIGLLILTIGIVTISEGARDPFIPTLGTEHPSREISPEQVELGELTLKAVMWGTDNPVALFETEEGKTFVVKVGAVIGKKGGKVTKIGDKLVIVQGSFGKKTFTIRGH